MRGAVGAAKHRVGASDARPTAPPPSDPPPEDLDEADDPTEKFAAVIPMRSVTLDEAFLTVVANDLWEESGFDIEVADALNIFGERGPNPILPDDFDLEEYFRRYDV